VNLTFVERDRRIEQYASAPERLREALAGVPAEAMKWRPEPGEFSVHEIICHCADAETNDYSRIRYVLAEKEPLIVAYDEEAWAVRLDYHNHPLDLALATVEAVRANTTALLRRVPEEAWERAGTHTKSGRFTTEDWLITCSEHLDEHIAQIEGNLRRWRARGPAEGSAVVTQEKDDAA